MIDQRVIDALLTTGLTPGSGAEALRRAGALDAESLSALLTHAEHLARTDPQVAGRLLDVVVESAEEAQAPSAGPRAGYLRARIAVQTGEPEQALAHISSARTGFEAVGDQLAALRTDLGLMHVLDDLGRHEDATKVGRSLLTALDAFGDTGEVAPLRAAASGNLGVALGFTGHHEEAIEAYRRAELEWRALGADHEAAAALANRGIELAELGDPAAAVTCLDGAAVAFERAGDPEWLSKCLSHRGAAHSLLGAFTDALADYERAGRLMDSLEVRTQSWRLSLETAATLLMVGLHDEAASLVVGLVPGLRRAGLRHDLADALAIAGRAYAEAQRPESARDALAEAAQLYRAVGDVTKQAGTLLDLSRVCRPEDAAAHLEQAAGLVDERSRLGLRCMVLVRRAELSTDDTLGADDLAAAQDLADDLGLPHLRLAVAEAMGARLRRLGDLDVAIACFERACAIVDQVSAALRDETLRSALMRSSGAARDGLIDTLVIRGAPGDVTRAAELADEGKGRTLVDLLTGRIGPGGRTDDAVGVSLTGQLNAAYSALFEADRYSRYSLRARAEDLERQLAVRATLTPSPPLGTVVRAGSGASPIGTSIAYHVLPQRVLAFVPAADGSCAVRDLGPTAEIVELVEDLEAHLSRRAAGVVARHGAARTEPCRRILHQLYLRLVAPVVDLLPEPDGVRRVLVVPHGVVHRVPFHALHDGTDHLVRTWQVSVVPSLSFARLGHRPTDTGESAMPAVVVGVSDPRTPRIEQEARAVAAAVGDATILLGAEATLERVRSAIDKAHLVHLACHGLFRFANPAFSSLRLADRWVRAADLSVARLNGAVLVLSACETARVNPLHGHETAGFARSFLAAGARYLVVSQWVADDRSTAVLMVLLHSRLAEGHDPAAALRLAQLDVMTQYPHPFHWAPFIAVGAPTDNDPTAGDSTAGNSTAGKDT